MPSPSILIVDDDRAFRIATAALLEDKQYSVTTAENALKARAIFENGDFDLVLTDLVMEGMNGLEFLTWVKEHSPQSVVMMITGFGSVATAVEAIRLGAYDYITKPSDNDELLIKIERGLEAGRQAGEVRRLRNELATRFSFGNIISQNETMRGVFRMMERVAETDVTVLVLGETGTGKELAAQAIHYNSARKTKPFVVINCSALSETLLESELFGHEKNAFTGAHARHIGKFEEADGGTVFLDEIGDVQPHIQTKLLRVLQEREINRVGANESIPVDVRVVAATHRDLNHMIRNGSFREDLFYRLNEFPLFLPPLRERPDDLPLLIRHFIRKHEHLAGGLVQDITPDALSVMTQYNWPGNIRELENFVKRALLTASGNALTSANLPSLHAAKAPERSDNLPSIEQPYKDYIKAITLDADQRYLLHALERHGGNISAVAELMGIDRKTVYRKIEEAGIKLEQFR